MGFIRCKIIGKGTYAYLVENQWTSKGSRQKIQGYLGKVIALTPCASATYVPSKEYGALVHHLIEQELIKHGFTQEGTTWRHQDIIVDIEQESVREGTRAVVLALNDGYLCTHTLREIHTYTPHLDNFEEELATRIIATGIAMPPSFFIHLYEAAKHLKTNTQPTKSNG
ncbi:hypothetical protein GF342_02655 [Candidatus Woesearchaeota archaeon]|nr:hypothetical protein [Candidatus Woesearchaeota archaeon]